jgi:hypothetical protein
VKEADLAATRPSSGASLRNRTCHRSWSACRGSQTGRVAQQRLLVRPFATRQSVVQTDRHCCYCWGFVGAVAAVQTVAGVAAVVVVAGSGLRVRREVGLGQRRRALVESRPGSRVDAIVS